MKKVESLERTTGMGAVHYTAVLLDGEWVRVSEHPEAKYLGRESGFNHFLFYVADDAVTAKFYRSNRGNEHVTASNGMEWNSFEEAREWASGIMLQGLVQPAVEKCKEGKDEVFKETCCFDDK